jgi:type II secretory pathway component PulL
MVKEGSKLRISIASLNLRAVTCLSAAFGLALTLASLPAAAQQWTPQQRAACEPDAMRLCQQYIPDIDRIRACMAHYRRYLSPACRALFEGGAKKRRS